MSDDEGQARLFGSAFDHASAGMTLVDDSGIYLRVNRAYADFIGYTVEELVGRYFGDFTCTRDHDADVALVGDLISGVRSAILREKEYRHRDGRILPALVSSTLVRPIPGGRWQLLSTVDSLTEQHSAQRQLAEMSSTVDGIVTVDQAGRIVAWNQGAERLLGYTSADMLGQEFAVVVPVRVRQEYQAGLAQFVAGGSPLRGTTVEVPAVHADGRELLTELSLSTWAHDGHPRYTAILRDVTVQRRAQRAAALIRHAAVTANSADAFDDAAADVVREVCVRLQWRAGHAWISGSERAVWHVGEHGHDAACTLSECAARGDAGSMSEMPGDGVALIVTDLARLKPWGGSLAGCGIGAAVAVPVLTGGEAIGVLSFYLPADIATPDHDLLQALEQIGLALGRVVERQRTNETLAWQATHDPVTDLANRRLLLDHIRDSQQACRSVAAQSALLLINLDRFRLVNDALGYAVGDQVLRLVAERLRLAAGPGNLLARLSADEFVVLTELPTDPGNTVSAGLAHRLLQALGEPLTIGGHELRLRASIGIRPIHAGNLPPGLLPAAVLRDADAALRQAKRRGKDQVVVFDGALAGTAVRRVDDEIALARAITEEQLLVHYQPIIALDTGRPVGAEALVRWNRPGQGRVAPDRFIPLAEDTGLIIDLGRWVLRRACRDAARWTSEAPVMADASVSVNVSPRQLTHPRFIGDLDAALADSGLPARRLTLEITETALISEPEAVMETLHEIRIRGVQLALDDFGTGYSSLSYVQKLPATILKIDKSFVDPITGPGAGTSLSEVVIKLADATGLVTVAEGVENPEQASALRLLGCHRGQGYTWSRPIAQNELSQIAGALSIVSDVPGTAV
ncbi:hypothetical protein Q0Z83_023230 [Actinoplanes sichuanensis]|uniref:EAL domain-containing protein n=1 Tax=Actinoplanes sichuanensis TaxID=512349 RepID=A0ABW4A0K3_9ACTN|nr:GGDEF domain-containing phosphodiesterase [Actinoplanes sichuanensis]BEL04132.1 hypothetical protein Q0Z83_023230 [Actinoplanes sichuanensis]